MYLHVRTSQGFTITVLGSRICAGLLTGPDNLTLVTVQLAALLQPEMQKVSNLGQLFV